MLCMLHTKKSMTTIVVTTFNGDFVFRNGSLRIDYEIRCIFENKHFIGVRKILFRQWLKSHLITSEIIVLRC